MEQLDQPHGLSLDISSDVLFIADSGNHRIVRRALSGSASQLVAGGNGGGLNSNQLFYPVNVYFDASTSSLLIVNTRGNNLLRWPIGSPSWTLVLGDLAGSSSSSSTHFSSPHSLVFDPWRNVLVSDTLNHRLQFFFANETSGSTPLPLLGRPQGVTFDPQFHLYVAESSSHRIERFLRV